MNFEYLCKKLTSTIFPAPVCPTCQFKKLCKMHWYPAIHWDFPQFRLEDLFLIPARGSVWKEWWQNSVKCSTKNYRCWWNVMEFLQNRKFARWIKWHEKLQIVCISTGAKACQSSRSWKILRSKPLASLVAKICFDTTASRPSKVWLTGVPV